MTGWFAANIVLVQSTFITFLLALSLQFPMRMGVLSFAGVGCYGIGGYVCGIAMVRFQLPMWPALALAIVSSLLVGYLLGVLIQRLNGLYLAMATIAFVLIVTVIAGNGGEITGGHTGLYGVIGQLNIVVIILLAVIGTAIMAATEIGGLGRRIRAVQQDPQLAASMGINVGNYRRMAFLISGALGGCAGAMQVLVRTTIQPEAIGFHMVVLVLTIIVIGGSGSWVGAFIGTVIFVWLPLLLSTVGEWRHVIYGLLVVVAAIYLPGGICGGLSSLFTRMRRARAQRRADTPGGSDVGAAGQPELAHAPTQIQARGGAR
jgi:branched-chain amino acid transport system permease protein